MKPLQLDIDYSRKLRDDGIKKAIDHADDELTSWSGYAKGHFRIFLLKKQSGDTFMIEDFREYLKGHLVEPPSARAFGAIAVWAVKYGMIEKAGYANVKNVLAHRTPATLWKKI